MILIKKSLKNKKKLLEYKNKINYFYFNKFFYINTKYNKIDKEKRIFLNKKDMIY